MTNQNTESNTGGQNSSPEEKEIKNLIDAYRVHLDVWKVQNDNYFRRVQVIMIAIQAALFFAAVNIVDVKDVSWPQIIVLLFLAVFGMISSWRWTKLNDTQNQYLEFCRRNLRNLEHELVKLKVPIPIRYFTLESYVFYVPDSRRQDLPNLAGTATKPEGNRDVAKFLWANEEYPDPNTDKKRIHELAKVKGGMIDSEKRIAFGIRWFWFVGFIVIVGIYIVQALL